jgi:hypothetical protein
MRNRAALMVAAVAAMLVATACTHGGQAPAGSQPPASRAGGPAGNGCAGQPPVSALPVWARSGFTPPDLAMPHVMGRAGDIVAILWAPRDALRSPALPDRANKILWVSRVPVVSPGDLVIKATLADGNRTITVTVPGGPGPSYVNAPAPGCWTFHLSWAGHTDQLSLRYAA